MASAIVGESSAIRDDGVDGSQVELMVVAGVTTISCHGALALAMGLGVVSPYARGAASGLRSPSLRQSLGIHGC